MTQPHPTYLIAPATGRRLATDLLNAAGATPRTARIVAEHLTAADARGVHSHGLIRIPQYLSEIAASEIDPGAEPVVDRQERAYTLVDGRGGFGQVAGAWASRIAVKSARRYAVSYVNVRHSGHTGRVGAYAEMIARHGMVGIVVASGTGSGGRWVAPFGGREGRLATNPIAFAVHAGEYMLAADFATSASAEGVVRSLHQRGTPAPPWMLHDAQGEMTTDTGVLYREPPGTIQQLGGDALGYKGTALGMLVEVLATLVGPLTFDDAESPHNTLGLLALKPAPGVQERVEAYASYVRSSSPKAGGDPIQLPGEPEVKALGNREWIPLDSPTRDALIRWAEQLGVQSPARVIRRGRG